MGVSGLAGQAGILPALRGAVKRRRIRRSEGLR